MTITADQIPGYTAGTWVVDVAHSEVGFSVRHLAISKVKGNFETFEGTITTAENPLDSSVEASADVASINTNQADRDGHLRTGDFFAAEEFPKLTFKSTGIRTEGSDIKVDGDLTLRGVTKQVTFDVDFGGIGTDAYGTTKLGLSATTVVKREDYGIKWNAPLETGGVLLGSDVTITLDIEADLQK